jgi:hypothetical protein
MHVAVFGTHLLCFGSQTKPPAQSSVVEHVVLHATPSLAHAKPSHETLACVAHAPLPSHVDRGTCVADAHDSFTHSVSLPGNPLHAARVWPSQTAFAHASAPDAHASRLPWGAPFTGVHVPFASTRSHASHCPLHAPSQQTPSTQKPDEHWLAFVHVWPCVSRQCPACGAPQKPPFALQLGSSQQKLLMHLFAPHAASLAHGSPTFSMGKQLELATSQ